MIVFMAPAARVLATLTAVSGVVGDKSVPILANAKIKKTGGCITFIGTTGEVQISSSGELGGDAGHYETTVPARKLVDLLKSMPPDQLVTLEDSRDNLVLKGGQSRITMRTLPARDFPIMNSSGVSGAVFSAPQRALRGMIESVAFAIPANDVRAYFNGALFLAEGRVLTLVSSNGTRIAAASAELDANTPLKSALLPRRSILELQGLLEDSDDPVQIHISSTQACFSFGGVEFLTNLLDSRFPDWRKVIPSPPPGAIHVSRAVILNSLSRAAIMAGNKSQGVHILLTRGILRISSANNNADESTDEIEVEYDGEDVATGFNLSYLVDSISNTRADTITLALGKSQAPLQMTVPGNERFRYVLSQMRL